VNGPVSHSVDRFRPLAHKLSPSGRWAYLKYTEITRAIGGNGAGTKFGVGGHLTRSVLREANCQIE
jgi:hypothetical protein